jgi:hypothetical protein
MEKNPCHFEPTEGSVRNGNGYRRFLNRRRAPHVEMTMDGVNQVPHKIQSCGSGEFGLGKRGTINYGHRL